MELTLTSEGVKTLVENIKGFQELDPSDDEGYELLMDRLRALQMQGDDILVEVGERESLTKLEMNERITNPYYLPVGILPAVGRKP